MSEILIEKEGDEYVVRHHYVVPVVSGRDQNLLPAVYSFLAQNGYERIPWCDHFVVMDSCGDEAAREGIKIKLKIIFRMPVPVDLVRHTDASSTTAENPPH